jgi:hypothetical protein
MTSYVTLSGLLVSHSRLSGINATAVSNVWVRGCQVTNTGGNGIDVAGSDSGVIDSVIRDVGCAGVRAGGGNWTTLVPGRMRVHNNVISNFSRWKRTYMPGLTWGGVGNNYTSNNISHGRTTECLAVEMQPSGREWSEETIVSLKTIGFPMWPSRQKTLAVFIPVDRQGGR